MRIGRAFPARIISKSALHYMVLPTGLAVSVVNGYATLTWTDNNPSSILMTLERKRGAGAYSIVSQSVNSADETYDDPTLLVEGQTYTYRLSFFFSSTTVSFSVPPLEHTNLQVFPSNDVSGNISMQLVWDKNAKYDYGTLVERSTDNSSWTTIATTAKGATTYEDTGLTADTLYYYRVSVIGALATSNPTSASATTKVNTAAGLTYAFLKKARAFPKE